MKVCGHCGESNFTPYKKDGKGNPICSGCGKPFKQGSACRPELGEPLWDGNTIAGHHPLSDGSDLD